jgi:hypothetical protein
VTAYLEFHLKGDGCAIVEAGMIGAVIAKGHDVWKVGTAEAPTMVVLRSGETVEIVGASPGGVIGRVVSARQMAQKLKYESQIEVFVDWLTPLNEGEADAAGGRPTRD